MKHLFPFVLLAILSVFAIKDLFRPSAYTSHDLTHHIVRTIHMDKILSQGQFPPRWVDELNWGYGYPLFLFNYPLPSLIAAGIHHLGPSYIWSVKLTFALSMVLSALGMYVYCRYLFRSREAGLVGGLFYLFAPIRFLNVYVSATFGNAVAFMFVPLIFWSLTKASRGEMDKTSFIGGVLSLAGLILSHNIMALLFLPIIALYGCLLIFLSRLKQRLRVFYQSTLLLFWGLSLSAFFLLPAMAEKYLIRYDEILPGFYKTHFPAWWQLIRSHWGYGFSFSGTELDDMSFQVGLAHILVVLIVLCLVARKASMLIVFFLLIFFTSIFLMLEISDPIWQMIVWLQYTQMPWRLLAVSVFSSSILAAWLSISIPHRKMVTIGLSLAVLVANRNHWRINEVLERTDADYMYIHDTTTMASEHLPKGAGKFDNTPLSEAKLTVLSGDADIIIEHNSATDVLATISARTPSEVRFNQIYFPGWKYVIDGERKSPAYERSQPLPQFTLDVGSYTFSATFRNTAVRTIADTVSLISGIGLLVLIFYPRRENR